MAAQNVSFKNPTTEARTGTWKAIELASRPDGGFVLISVWAFVAAWWASRTGDLRPADLRVWLASFEAKARRCGAHKGRRVQYSVAELAELVGTRSLRGVRASLTRLRAVRLMAWSERGPVHAESLDELALNRPGATLDALELLPHHHRRVPVPRRLIRELCRVQAPTLLATAFGHLLRCMFNRRRVCASGGLCKASWVAEVFGVSTRSVKRGRSRLVASTALIRERTPQRVMNRHEGFVRWNLKCKPQVGKRTEIVNPVRRVCCVTVSPPHPSTNIAVSPPRETSNSLTGSENQQPHPGGHTETVNTNPRHGARPSREEVRDVRRPRGLGYVEERDLRTPDGIGRLFKRATACGLVKPSEAGSLAVVAAAAHALRVARQNPGGLFATVVRRGLWSYIGGEDEDRARRLAKVIWQQTASRDPSQEPPATHVVPISEAGNAAVRERVRASLASVEP